MLKHTQLMKTLRNKIIIVVLITVIFSCKEQNPKIVITSSNYHQTVDKLTSVMIHDVFSPPVASRIYVYPSIAANEVLGGAKSLSEKLNDLKVIKSDNFSNINLELASLIAYIDVAKELIFSKELLTSYRDSLYNVWSKKNHKSFIRSKKHGLHYSKQILNWMNKDNYSQTRTYPEHDTNSDSPSAWKPTPPAYMDGIEPHWNKIRPFTLDSASQFKPQKHPEFSLKKSSSFYKELLEVYTIKKEIEKKGDSSEEIAMARFWDCNPYVTVNKGHYMFAEKKITPGAHWIGICKIACKKNKLAYKETVNAYTLTSIAIADAFISCWDEKYRSNLIRPETLINTLIDDSWQPVLQTPPFPEYTSGHSVVSGAASTILTKIFGNNFKFDDTTEIPYGLPTRSFNSFNHAAKEAAMSRLYGGIHYKSAITIGLTQGKNIGEFITKKLTITK